MNDPKLRPRLEYETITVLQGFDAVAYLFDGYGPEYPEIAGLWSDFYYTGLYDGVPNAGDPGAWYDWRRAVRAALVTPATEAAESAGQPIPSIPASTVEDDLPEHELPRSGDLVTVLQSYRALIRLLEQYSYFHEVAELLPTFTDATAEDSSQLASKTGWNQWRSAVQSAIDDPLATD